MNAGPDLAIGLHPAGAADHHEARPAAPPENPGMTLSAPPVEDDEGPAAIDAAAGPGAGVGPAAGPRTDPGPAAGPRADPGSAAVVRRADREVRT